jgi:hypothetical protein
MFGKTHSQWWNTPSGPKLCVSKSIIFPEPISGNLSLPFCDDGGEVLELARSQKGPAATTVENNWKNQSIKEFQTERNVKTSVQEDASSHTSICSAGFANFDAKVLLKIATLGKSDPQMQILRDNVQRFMPWNVKATIAVNESGLSPCRSTVPSVLNDGFCLAGSTVEAQPIAAEDAMDFVHGVDNQII